jgi:tetratricopeptide (TPR) repeat protein
MLLMLAPFGTHVAEAAGAADLNEAGKQAYHRGDHAHAEQLFGQAIAQSPSDPLLHYHRGIALSRLSRWAEAARSYEAALRLSPPPALAASIREALRSAAPFSAPRAAPLARQTISPSRCSAPAGAGSPRSR